MKKVVYVVCVALFVVALMLSNLFLPVCVEAGNLPRICLYSLWAVTGVSVFSPIMYVQVKRG